MLWRLALAGLLAVSTEAFASAPIRWGGLPARNLYLAAEHSASSNMVEVSPYKLTILDQPIDVPSNLLLSFTATLDNTIACREKNSCIEASGIHKGATIRLNRCTGGPTQRWNWLPVGPGQKSQIQLQITSQCLDVIDKESSMTGVAIELRECENKASQAWKLEETTPLPIPSPLQHSAVFIAMWHILMSTSVLVLSFSVVCWRWQKRSESSINEGVQLWCMDRGGVSLKLPMVMQRGDVHDSVTRISPAAMTLSSISLENDFSSGKDLVASALPVVANLVNHSSELQVLAASEIGDRVIAIRQANPECGVGKATWDNSSRRASRLAAASMIVNHGGCASTSGSDPARASAPTMKLDANIALGQPWQVQCCVKLATLVIYWAATAVLYGYRSGGRHNLSIRDSLRGKFQRPENMPVFNYGCALFGWLAYLGVYPLLETVGLMIGFSTFYYYYPNAQGAGVIFAPRGRSSALDSAVKRLFIRFDWHAFQMKKKRGQLESLILKWPHVNSQSHNLKAWPWRHHAWLVELVLLRPLRFRIRSSICYLREHMRVKRLVAKLNFKPANAVLAKSPLWNAPYVLVEDMLSELEFDNVWNTVERAWQDRRHVQVAVDAEWGGGGCPLSLLQLAVSVQGVDQVQVVIVDMLAKPSDALLMKCRKLLMPSPDVLDFHRVLTFSPHRDVRRLVEAGVLPLAGRGGLASLTGWTDLQSVPWGLGENPGLQKVVRHCLGANLNKRMQTSDWDKRPLSEEQLRYAAVDAECLLDLSKVAKLQ